MNVFSDTTCIIKFSERHAMICARTSFNLTELNQEYLASVLNTSQPDEASSSVSPSDNLGVTTTASDEDLEESVVDNLSDFLREEDGASVAGGECFDVAELQLEGREQTHSLTNDRTSSVSSSCSKCPILRL